MAAGTKALALPERVSFAHIPDIRPMPGLIQIQLDSFEWFKKEGLRELFEEISPEDIMELGVPESFKVLVKELQSLGINVEVRNSDEQQIQFVEGASNDVMPELGTNVYGFEGGQ